MTMPYARRNLRNEKVRGSNPLSSTHHNRPMARIEACPSPHRSTRRSLVVERVAAPDLLPRYAGSRWLPLRETQSPKGTQSGEMEALL